MASELVAGELAAWFGLRVPDFAVVEISDIDIPMRDAGTMEHGPAFASRKLAGTTADGTDLYLKLLNRPGDVSRIIIFDTWVRNADRCPPADAADPEPRRDNLFFTPVGRKFELVALDHSHCFVEGALEDEIVDAHLVSDDRMYGVFPEFVGFIEEADVLAAADRLRRIDAESVREIVDSVPPRWAPSRRTRDAWIKMIMERAAVVAEYAPERLIVQGQIGL